MREMSAVGPESELDYEKEDEGEQYANHDSSRKHNVAASTLPFARTRSYRILIRLLWLSTVKFVISSFSECDIVRIRINYT